MRGTVGQIDPAIVRDVHDECVVAELMFIEEREQLSARFVEPFAHRPILGDRS